MTDVHRGVELVEVVPRDGLQDEPAVVATEHKVAIVEAALAAGLRRIEVASFVRGDRVPQMADAEAVIAALPRRDGVSYIGLVLNERGMDRAERTGLHEVNTVVPMTDRFGLANQGATVDQALATAVAVADRARAAGMASTATLAVAFGCPHDGLVPTAAVLAAVDRLVAAGVDEVALADTIGCAVPDQVAELVAAVVAASDAPVRVHLHDSRGTGLANALAAVQAGAGTLDVSLAGLGGCPFAGDVGGNLATEDLLWLFDRMGIATGVDPAAAIEAARLVEDVVGHRGNGRAAHVQAFPVPA